MRKLVVMILFCLVGLGMMNAQTNPPAWGGPQAHVNLGTVGTYTYKSGFIDVNPPLITTPNPYLYDRVIRFTVTSTTKVVIETVAEVVWTWLKPSEVHANYVYGQLADGTRQYIPQLPIPRNQPYTLAETVLAPGEYAIGVTVVHFGGSSGARHQVNMFFYPQ